MQTEALKLIDDINERQDEALRQIDELNSRIEALVELSTAAARVEAEDENPEAESQDQHVDFAESPQLYPQAA